MQININTKYAKEKNAELVFGVYDNGQVALVIKSNLHHSILMKPTVTGNKQMISTVLTLHNKVSKTNLTLNDVVLLKTYSENEGIEECLLDQLVISRKIADIVEQYSTHQIEMPLYELSDSAKTARRQTLN